MRSHRTPLPAALRPFLPPRLPVYSPLVYVRANGLLTPGDARASKFRRFHIVRRLRRNFAPKVGRRARHLPEIRRYPTPLPLPLAPAIDYTRWGIRSRRLTQSCYRRRKQFEVFRVARNEIGACRGRVLALARENAARLNCIYRWRAEFPAIPPHLLLAARSLSRTTRHNY